MKKYGLVFGLASGLGALSALGIGSLQDSNVNHFSMVEYLPQPLDEAVVASVVGSDVLAVECKGDVDDSMAGQATSEPIVCFDPSHASCGLQSPDCGPTPEPFAGSITNINNINLLNASDTIVLARHLVSGEFQLSDGSVSFGSISLFPVTEAAPEYQPKLQGPYSGDAPAANPAGSPNFRLSVGSGFRLSIGNAYFVNEPNTPASSVKDEPDLLGFDRRLLVEAPPTRTEQPVIANLEGTGAVTISNLQFNQIAPSTAAECPTATVSTPAESLACGETSADEAKKLSRLREYLTTLTKARAELMDEAALASEIMKAELEIVNLRALHKIIDVEQSLQKIIDEFPDSPAAQRARSMLEVKPGAAGNFVPTERLPMY